MNAKNFLREHPEIYATIEKKVLEHFGVTARAGEFVSNAVANAEKAEKAERGNGSTKRAAAAPRGEA